MELQCGLEYLDGRLISTYERKQACEIMFKYDYSKLNGYWLVYFFCLKIFLIFYMSNQVGGINLEILLELKL